MASGQNALGLSIPLGKTHVCDHAGDGTTHNIIPTAKSLRANGSDVLVTDGPYLETKEHVGGFWVLECADMDEAMDWGRKAVAACRANVEVRQFH